MVKLLRFLSFILIPIVLIQSAYALPIIRDDETEEVIREIAKPIFKAAGLSRREIEIVILNDNEVNAFVEDGRRIFIHSGIIGFSNDPAVLAGVIAHECGHMTGGHVIRNISTIKDLEALVMLGIAAGIVSSVAGSTDLGSGIASGTTSMLYAEAMHHSQGNERSADMAALKYLSKANISPHGMISLLKDLSSNERVFYSEKDKYLLTHPISRERINYLNQKLGVYPNSGKGISPDLRARYEMVSAKIMAFTLPSADIMREFHNKTGDNASYARAIMYFRAADLKKAIIEIDHLISKHPGNEYLHELKGQFLFENGKVTESIHSFSTAFELNRRASSIPVEFGLALLEAKRNSEALQVLKIAVHNDPKNTMAWHALGKTYAAVNDEVGSYIAFAEEALIANAEEEAKKYIAQAEKLMKDGKRPIDPSFVVRLHDLKAAVKTVS